MMSLIFTKSIIQHNFFYRYSHQNTSENIDIFTSLYLINSTLYSTLVRGCALKKLLVLPVISHNLYTINSHFWLVIDFEA